VSDRPDTEPSRGDVLLDLCTGAAAGAGDLFPTFVRLGVSDRDPAVAFGSLWIILPTGAFASTAELSTILLRRLFVGRSASLGITSETVSGVRDAKGSGKAPG